MTAAGWNIEQGTGGGWWVEEDRLPNLWRCYVCGVGHDEPCAAIDGEVAECPRPDDNGAHCMGGKS